MELNININLSNEDIEKGLTAYDIVEMLFPSTAQTVTEFAQQFEEEEPEVEVQEDEAEQEAQEDASIRQYDLNSTVEEVLTDQANDLSNNNEQQEEVNEEPAPGSLPPRDDDPATQELDSAGVPWDSEIHSSGKSKYKSGPDKGRWVWKRGSVPEERERIAQVLKDEVERSRSKSEAPAPAGNVGPVPVPSGPAVAAPRPENSQPAPGPAVAPRPENSGAASAETVTPAPAAAAALQAPVDWKTLLNALDEHEIDANTTYAHLQEMEIDQIALLARDDFQEQRDELARRLGLIQ